jgi:hypothetical protein
LPHLASWARERGLRSVELAGPVGARVGLRRGWRPRRRDVVLLNFPPWVELHVVQHGHEVDHDHRRPSGPGQPVLPRRQVDALNSLLSRFDRPTLPHRPPRH